MKVYKAKHTNKKALSNHVCKIKRRGGKVEVNDKTNTISYWFPEGARKTPRKVCQKSERPKNKQKRWSKSHTDLADKQNSLLIESVTKKYKKLPLVKSVHNTKKNLLKLGMPKEYYEALIDTNEEGYNFIRAEKTLLKLGCDNFYDSLDEMVNKIKQLQNKK